MSISEDRRTWTEQLAAGQFRSLFDHLPGTLFFAKDIHRRLMGGNPAFVNRCGFRTEDELIGLTDAEIFPPRLAEKFRLDDERVIRSGTPLLGLIELFPQSDAKPGWFITDKLPLLDRHGAICGLCGTVRNYEAQRVAMLPYFELSAVADHLKTNFREKLDVSALAKMSRMSVRQFERKFRSTFQMTPRDFMIRMRVIEACRLLDATDLAVTAIALESGFYDHSDFARQFRRQMGLTATAYRRSRLVRPLAPKLPNLGSGKP